MQDLTDPDYDLDKLDEAASIEDAKSSSLKFNFSYSKVIAISLLLVLVQHTLRVM